MANFEVHRFQCYARNQKTDDELILQDTTLPWRMLWNWLWISRCGDYWQQAELCT